MNNHQLGKLMLCAIIMAILVGLVDGVFSKSVATGIWHAVKTFGHLFFIIVVAQAASRAVIAEVRGWGRG